MVFVLKGPYLIPYPSLKRANEKSPEDSGRTRKKDNIGECLFSHGTRYAIMWFNAYENGRDNTHGNTGKY